MARRDLVPRAGRRRAQNTRDVRVEDALIDPTDRTWRRYAACFTIAAALRFLCLIPFVIDDDEAWWSASARALRSPWDFYHKAVDNKPPGVVWFYWLVGRVLAHGEDPRVARAVYTTLCVGAAALLGWIAARTASPAAKPRAGWMAATLFLLVSACSSPKLLSVTTDGLLSLLVISSYATALLGAGRGSSLVSGALLGMAVLVRQTAVLFAIPLLAGRFPGPTRSKARVGVAIGSAAVVLPAVFGLGASDFIYWNWTYPIQTLFSVRDRIFDPARDLLLNSLLFGALTLPLIAALVKSMIRGGFPPLRDFRVLWLLAGAVAALLGKGLFLHYFLLLVPPLVLLGTGALCGERSPARAKLAWIATPYAICCALLAVPYIEVLWGTDLRYFEELQKPLSRALRPGQKLLVWGGSALPLVYSRAPYATRFILPRFAVPPYLAGNAREIYHRELAQDPPALVLDLHERSDNRFGNPLESEPFVASMVRERYRLYLSPSIPWAKFYFREPPPPESGLVEARDGPLARQAYFPFPETPRAWLRFEKALRGGEIQHLAHRVFELDRTLRAEAALELIERQNPSPTLRSRARLLRASLSQSAPRPIALQEFEAFFSEVENLSGSPPLPWHSAQWWLESALVQLQPTAASR